MEYYFEKNVGELSEELFYFLSLSHHENSNTNQNPKSNKRKTISTDKFEGCVLHNVSIFDLTNGNVKNKNDSKYSLFNVQRRDILPTAKRKGLVKNNYLFGKNNPQNTVKFLGLKENSNVEKNQIASLDKSIKEDKKEVKQLVTNKTLSSAVYSQISRGGRANNKAVIRAIKEKGAGGMDELFSNMRPKNPSKHFLYEETLITPVFEGVIAQDPPKTSGSIKQKDDSLVNNDRRQMTESIFSKSTDKNEKAAAAAIKEKGSKGLSDLFADMKNKNPKNEQKTKLSDENIIVSDINNDDRSTKKFTNKSLTSAVYSNMGKGVKGNDKAVISAVKQQGPNGLNDLFSNIKARSSSKFNRPEENDIDTVFEGKLVSESQKINNTVKSEQSSKVELEDKRPMNQSVFSKTNNKNEKSTASQIKQSGTKGVNNLFADMKQSTSYKKQPMPSGEARPLNSDGKSIASSTASKPRGNLLERGINEKGELFSSKYPASSDIFKHTVIDAKRMTPPVISKNIIDRKQELHPTIKGKVQEETLESINGFTAKSPKPHEESSKATLIHSKMNTISNQKETLVISAIKNKEPINLKNVIIPESSKLLHHEAQMHMAHSITDKKVQNFPKLKHTLSPNKNDEFDFYKEEPFRYSPKSVSPIHPPEPQKPFVDLKTGFNAQAGPIIDYLKFPSVKSEQLHKTDLNKTVFNVTNNTQTLIHSNSKENQPLTLFTRKSAFPSLDSELSEFSLVECSDTSLFSEDEEIEKFVETKNVFNTVLNILFPHFSSHKSGEDVYFKLNSLRNNIEKQDSKASNKKRNLYEAIKYGVLKMNDLKPKHNQMIQEASKTMGLVKPGSGVKPHTFSPEAHFNKFAYKYPTLENLEHPQTVIHRNFDSNICEICGGYLHNSVENKTRCLCDSKNSEQTMWRRHSLERMNDFSVREKTMLISMFIPLTKGNSLVLLDLDNSRITPEQKKKLKSLKKKKRKKTIYNLQNPQYLIHPFTIRRTETV